MSENEEKNDFMVNGILNKRFNKELNEEEWLVAWSDNDQTWEFKENLMDEEGTMNAMWLKFQVSFLVSFFDEFL